MNSILSPYRLPCWETVYYIPDFVSEDEERHLIRKIQSTPQPKWKQLTNRRLQLLGGEMTSKNILVPQPMPSYVAQFPDLITRLRDSGVFKSSPHGQPNHIILNEYRSGQGIMPHQDGPAYHPVVATVSLGSHTVFHYYKYTTEDVHKGRSVEPIPILSLLLEPRSVVITTDSLYTQCLHGIDPLEVDQFAPGTFADSRTVVGNQGILTTPEIQQVVNEGGELKRATRYSLTCRDVEKVKRGPV